MEPINFFLPQIERARLLGDWVTEIDHQIENFFYAFRDPFFVKIFTRVSLLGKWQIILVFAAILSILFLIREKKSCVVPLWIVIFGSQLSGSLTKLALRLPRPESAVYQESSYSFPSGHATMAAAFYGFILYFLWRNVRGRSAKIISSLGVLAVILAIGLSRLYLGVHFLSDVLAGYLFGFFWLIVGIGAGKRFFQKKKN